MIRLTGPKWDPDEEVVTTALHDKQKFKVEELLDYVVGDDVIWNSHNTQHVSIEEVLSEVTADNVSGSELEKLLFRG